MNFYTVILDYAGGTHLAQVRAQSADAALRVRASDKARADSLGLAESVWHEMAEAVAEEAEEAGALPVQGMRDIWYANVLVADKLALVHVVRTVPG